MSKVKRTFVPSKLTPTAAGSPGFTVFTASTTACAKGGPCWPIGPSCPCGISKVKCKVLPTTLTLALAGVPGGSMAVLSTCAAETVRMASMMAFSPLSWLRICTASSGVPSWGRLGSNMAEKGLKMGVTEVGGLRATVQAWQATVRGLAARLRGRFARVFAFRARLGDLRSDAFWPVCDGLRLAGEAQRLAHEPLWLAVQGSRGGVRGVGPCTPPSEPCAHRGVTERAWLEVKPSDHGRSGHPFGP